MRRVSFVIHEEPDGWWAFSPDIPRYSPGAPTLEMLRAILREGAEFHFGEPVEIVEEPAAATAV